MSTCRCPALMALVLLLTAKVPHENAWAEEPKAQGILVKSGQKIVFLGDSITTRGVAPVGYVSLTIAGLKSNGIEATAIGACIGGQESHQMLERVSIEAFLSRKDRKDAGTALQDALIRRLDTLTK